MTRLDSVIRRLTAQRALLDWAAGQVAEMDGLILELGLGNGRTYDHLRHRLPGRVIYAFERWPAAHPDCTPAADRLVVGDMIETLPAFRERFGSACAALVHADIGTGDEAWNREAAASLSPLIEPLLKTGGLLLGDRPFDLSACTDLSSETGVEEGRYFVYRKESACPVSTPAGTGR